MVSIVIFSDGIQGLYKLTYDKHIDLTDTDTLDVLTTTLGQALGAVITTVKAIKRDEPYAIVVEAYNPELYMLSLLPIGN